MTERRDPRAERLVRRVRDEKPSTALPIQNGQHIPNPTCIILAVLDVDGGHLGPLDRELLGAARLLADDYRGVVAAHVTNPRPDVDFGAVGIDRVLRLEIDGYAPERRAASVIATMNELAPKHVLFSDVPTGGGDIGRRVAASLAERPASTIYGLGPMQVVRHGGNRLEFVGKPTRIMLLLPGAAAPVSPARHKAVPITPPEFDQISRLQDRGLLPLSPDTVALSEALLVCSAGNGVTDWASFRAVAAAIGATIGGSRVVCDAGFLARDRQVGASGISVRARCYLAFGISGAAQHLHGIADCESVIAVNSDPHAPIMNRADLAVVADAQVVLPALLQLLESPGERGPPS